MTIVQGDVRVGQVAGFELLAHLGKRVLRPGGVELTRTLLDELDIAPTDDVVEVAAGRGRTARLVLDCDPASYVAIDRDLAAERVLAPMLQWPEQQFRRASASHTGLADSCCDVAIGEAILTMQPAAVKDQMVKELARLVRPGGRLGLHEVAFRLDDLDHTMEQDEIEEIRIRSELTAHFKVAFNALELGEWQALLDDHGFDVGTVREAPLRLLEPDRLLADEGLLGSARFAANLMRDKAARRRVEDMRIAMQRNAHHLVAIALVAVRRIS
jgi:SAM-dependent methyltransferase